MSYKELAIQLINNMPDYKLGYAIAYLQGLVADEVPMTCIVQDY